MKGCFLDSLALGSMGSDASVWIAFLKILFIDIVLSGDNAVVIAMAVRSLAPKQRRKGILFGAGAAVLLRLVLTGFATWLLHVPLIKFFGGFLILWIAVKLLREESFEEGHGKHAETIWHAVWMILIADITMSVDNILAIAGAANGNFFLLLLGLGLSIPLVLFTSNLLANLMAKFPAIVFVGAGILAHVGSEMIFSDPWVEKYLQPSKTLLHSWMALCIGGVLISGWQFKQKQKKRIRET